MVSDLLVVELASVLAGPSVGMFLAELGAEVIKVENPHTGGDVTRSWRLASESTEDDRSAYFSSVNWGKKSISLDLKEKSDRQKIKALLGRADVLISSFRPGQAEQYGLDAGLLQQQFPRLIIVEISGYGPEDSRPAFDAIIQAACGFTYMNGPAGRGGEKMPVALMDILAAHHAKEGLLLALLNRMKTGMGGLVQVDLLSAGLSSLANQASNYLVAGVVPGPIGSAHPNIAPYGERFETVDGPLILAVGNDRQFAGLCQLLDWDFPEKFGKNAARVKEREAVNRELAGRIKAWPREALLKALSEAGVPAGPVNDIAEAMELDQAKALMLEGGGLRGLRTFSGSMGKFPAHVTAPPHLNQHQTEIEAYFDEK
ncbi:MAG: CoA transferase [Bacteroidia bacterium]